MDVEGDKIVADEPVVVRDPASEDAGDQGVTPEGIYAAVAGIETGLAEPQSEPWPEGGTATDDYLRAVAHLLRHDPTFRPPYAAMTDDERTRLRAAVGLWMPDAAWDEVYAYVDGLLNAEQRRGAAIVYGTTSPPLDPEDASEPDERHSAPPPRGEG